MSEPSRELNLDGLPGPTHNYAGLSPGNLASQQHKQRTSNPRAAALQGLAKMKQLADLGVPQAVLPPHARPDVMLLRRLGFHGPPAKMLAEAQRDAPELLAAACSASSMWTANAATVCPSADARDRRVHFTPANLIAELHRSIEPATTSVLLRRIFSAPRVFAHHEPLPAVVNLRDEGAANHTRLCRAYGEPGIQLFVYGMHGIGDSQLLPEQYPARQTHEASQSVARLHRLPLERVLFAQQHPDVIDAGVFHNDVAAVGDRNVFFYHARAFVAKDEMLPALRRMFREMCGGELRAIEVTEREVPLDEAVRTYLFNSQILQAGDGTTLLLAPQQCRESPRVHDYLESLSASGEPFQRVYYVELLESMRNGGGPACLRLRVALTEQELAHVHAGVMLDDALYERLVQWVQAHYRDELKPADLADPQLLTESRAALDELSQLLELGSVYPFQQVEQEE